MITVSAALGGERQRVHVALAQLGRVEPGLGELGAGEAEHFRAAVDAERLVGAAAEQFDHPAGAGADVDQPADRRRPASARAIAASTSLSATWSERKRVPVAGVAGEIALGGGGAVGAHGGEPGGVGGGPGIGAVELGPAVDQLEQGLDPRPRARG